MGDNGQRGRMPSQSDHDSPALHAEGSRVDLCVMETDNRVNDVQQPRQKGGPMGQAEALIQRHITVPHGPPDPNPRKEPFIRDKGTPVWVVVRVEIWGRTGIVLCVEQSEED